MNTLFKMLQLTDAHLLW